MNTIINFLITDSYNYLKMAEALNAIFYSFEDLPNEIILCIMDQMSVVDVISTLPRYNLRPRSK